MMIATKVHRNELVEVERTMSRTLLMNSAIGLVPGRRDDELSQIRTVLEIGCGPGTWSLEMAQTAYHQQVQVWGVDTSRVMICYAQTQARDRCLQERVHYYLVDNVAGPFSFPDRSFDFISAQSLSQLLSKDDWPLLFKECLRLLRPGGQICLTDSEVGMSNAPAHEELSSLYICAMRLAGRSLSQGDRHLGLLCNLEPMLATAGFESTRCVSHTINYSKGAAMHNEWKRNALLQAKSVQPFLVDTGVATQEHMDQLYQRLLIEMNVQAFHAILPMFTLWGQRPVRSEGKKARTRRAERAVFKSRCMVS